MQDGKCLGSTVFVCSRIDMSDSSVITVGYVIFGGLCYWKMLIVATRLYIFVLMLLTTTNNHKYIYVLDAYGGEKVSLRCNCRFFIQISSFEVHASHCFLDLY